MPYRCLAKRRIPSGEAIRLQDIWLGRTIISQLCLLGCDEGTKLFRGAATVNVFLFLTQTFSA